MPKPPTLCGGCSPHSHWWGGHCAEKGQIPPSENFLFWGARTHTDTAENSSEPIAGLGNTEIGEPGQRVISGLRKEVALPSGHSGQTRGKSEWERVATHPDTPSCQPEPLSSPQEGTSPVWCVIRFVEGVRCMCHVIIFPVLSVGPTSAESQVWPEVRRPGLVTSLPYHPTSSRSLVFLHLLCEEEKQYLLHEPIVGIKREGPGTRLGN